MNRILTILSALFLLVSCQKDERIETSEQSVLTYTVSAPFEFEIKSSTNGQGSKINALWYGVYHKKADGSFMYMSDMSAYVPVANASREISVPITLFKDQEYKIIFVAQHVKAVPSASGDMSNCYTYIINENGHMSLNPKAVITDGEQFDGEQLDAFVYWEQTGVIKNDYKKEIELERPLAQINISTTAAEKPGSIDIAVSGTAGSYNIFEETYSQATDNPVSFNRLSCNGASLATVYFLPAGNSVGLDMTMYYGAGSEAVTKTLQVQNVSVAPNYKTNITGNI